MRSRAAGMTLVELLTALVLLSLVAIAVSVLLLSARQSHDTVKSQNAMQKAAQRAADTVMDGLRGAQELTAGDDNVVSASFKSGDTVSYYLDAGCLKRDRYVQATGQTISGELICDHVTSLSLDYLSASGAPVPAALAQSVVISLRIADGKEGATETSMVRLRNKFST